MPTEIIYNYECKECGKFTTRKETKRCPFCGKFVKLLRHKIKVW